MAQIYVLVVSSLVDSTLDEGEDWTLTIGDNDYNYDSDYFGAALTTDGIDGDYADLTGLGQLEDVFGEAIQFACYDNPFELAYLVSDVDASSSTVYGIVTDLTISGLFDNVTDVTILNQDGEEVTYDLDDDDIFTFNGTTGATESGYRMSNLVPM